MAPFCGHDNYAVGAADAINSRSGCIFQNSNIRNFIGIHGVELVVSPFRRLLHIINHHQRLGAVAARKC